MGDKRDRVGTKWEYSTKIQDDSVPPKREDGVIPVCPSLSPSFLRQEFLHHAQKLAYGRAPPPWGTCHHRARSSSCTTQLARWGRRCAPDRSWSNTIIVPLAWCGRPPLLWGNAAGRAWASSCWRKNKSTLRLKSSVDQVWTIDRQWPRRARQFGLQINNGNNASVKFESSLAEFQKRSHKSYRYHQAIQITQELA